MIFRLCGCNLTGSSISDTVVIILVVRIFVQKSHKSLKTVYGTIAKPEQAWCVDISRKSRPHAHFFSLDLRNSLSYDEMEF